MPERKKVEQEAITILGNLGIEVDKGYYDDNSHKSMPETDCVAELMKKYQELTR